MNWRDMALGSSAEIIIVQSVFMIIVSSLRIRHLINTRIGGLEAIEVSSWPRLIFGILVCNTIFLIMHHYYVPYAIPVWTKVSFVGLFCLAWALASIVSCLAGMIFDGGRAICVLTDRFKPEHAPWLVDMTKDDGKFAQLIPRGAIFSYNFIMLFAWVMA